MKVAVHDGKFHADDVLAVAILKLIYPDLKIIRTIDSEVMSKVDMRVDVGRKYNFDSMDFDHHQKDFDEKRDNGIPYASAGLIWRHFGERLIRDKKVFDYIDENIIQPIDCEDAGIKTYVSKIANPFTFGKFVVGMNPKFSSETPFAYDSAFEETVEFVSRFLKNEIDRAGEIFAVRDKVLEKIKSSNGEYVVFEENLPWEKFVVEESDSKFVIVHYPDRKTWSAYAVKKRLDDYKSRRSFPEEWGGLFNEDLQKITGVDDAIFCHKALFVVVAKSKEGIVKLVEMALEKDK